MPQTTTKIRIRRLVWKGREEKIRIPRRRRREENKKEKKKKQDYKKMYVGAPRRAATAPP